ncbi:di-heme oxidoredictase family protein [Rhizobium mayense]|uniref:Di-heme oxidoredictase family protein n=1 Tax=Rhizobium mayense TaxID=1312184 RepID=A0ABT7JXB7_9HYPH|nr:di-heme oxidoredictase family protein [Rhizobium mayense]MDL2400413.1 di-heme oxidoredictase family protein [Rhizobium mayense]
MKRMALMCLCLAATGLPAIAAQPWEEKTAALGQAGAEVSGHQTVEQLKNLIKIGEALFTARFTVEDGAGRPGATQAIVPTKRKHPVMNEFSRTAGVDANACSSCHNMPFPGGAGDFTTNVFVSEGFESADFDTTDPQFSNERGTNSLFGDGLVELLAREMTVDLQRQRGEAITLAAKTGQPQRVALETKGVKFGWLTAQPNGLVDMRELDGVDMDLVIRPFSQKGVMTSLRQFTVNALNQHHGMEPVERFGGRWTGTRDFDGDGHADEISDGDVSALVAWQATLPAPVQKVPDNAQWRDMAAAGEKLFDGMGCTACHRTSLPLDSLSFSDPGPNDVAGTLNVSQVKDPAVYDLSQLDWTKKLKRNDKGQVLVPLFGDLKRHTITDSGVDQLGNELLAQRFVDRNIFMTAELWGVASTPPYGHRNDITTLDGVIRAHGGDGRAARDTYVGASDEDRARIIAFLKTLVIEQAGVKQ